MSPPEIISTTPFPVVPTITETGVLLQPEMARATVAGLKTQTRRLFKVPKGLSWYAELGGEVDGWLSDDDGPGWCHVDELRAPYGSIGDRIWGREAYRTYASLDDLPPRAIAPGAGIQFEAGGSNVLGRESLLGMGKYRPSMFMCRWMSRIVRELTDVRVERLLDITEADAIAEGVSVHRDHHAKPSTSIYSPVQAYRDLWEQLNGAGSWDANPWAWAIEFKRIKP